MDVDQRFSIQNFGKSCKNSAVRKKACRQKFLTVRWSIDQAIASVAGNAGGLENFRAERKDGEKRNALYPANRTQRNPFVLQIAEAFCRMATQHVHAKVAKFVSRVDQLAVS